MALKTIRVRITPRHQVTNYARKGFTADTVALTYQGGTRSPWTWLSAVVSNGGMEATYRRGDHVPYWIADLADTNNPGGIPS